MRSYNICQANSSFTGGSSTVTASMCEYYVTEGKQVSERVNYASIKFTENNCMVK